MQQPPARTAPSDLSIFIGAMQTGIDRVLPTPAPHRCRNEVPPNFMPCQSGRIAKADRGLDSEMKAKRVLLHRLGLLKDDNPVDEATLAKYAALFERPLAEDIIQAFADFYGWHIPPTPYGDSRRGTESPRPVKI